MPDESLHPETGGRVLLELADEVAAYVSYRVTLYLPDGVLHRSEVRLDFATGRPSLDAFEPPNPPAWLVESVGPFLRQLWTQRRGPNAPRWPRRVLRWRAPRVRAGE
ncbi:MAG: hypothetical protein AAGH15_26030 [Myxococcota bacterium]